ncbi:MAG: sporulation protein [candidate division Zixibacteria bacterium]|nr:sporulation protein [candidate division Zixibacteria bacterium]
MEEIMNSKLDDLMRSIVGELRSMAKSETVVGQPITAGKNTVVPLCKVSVGFGAGGGEGEKNTSEKGFGGGGGGGASIEPVAFIVISDDRVSLLSTKGKKYEDLLSMIPDAIKGVIDLAGGSKKGKGKGFKDNPEEEERDKDSEI